MSFLTFLIAHEIYELSHPRRDTAAGFGGVRVDTVKDGMIYGVVMLVVALLLHPSFVAILIGLLLFCGRFVILSMSGYVARGRGAALKGLLFHEITHALLLYFMARLAPQARGFALLGEWLGVRIGVRALFVAFGYLTLTWPTALFVRLVLERLRGGEEEAVLDGAGQMIGIIERLIIFTLGLSGQYAAVGFMIAAKSVARFKKFEERDFAEVYIVGTLASIGVAVLLSNIYGVLPR
jgi:hypothetical protein